jgi:hypothetical protein
MIFFYFLLKGVAHKEEGHNFVKNEGFAITLIGVNERKTCLNFQRQGAVIPELCNHLINILF